MLSFVYWIEKFTEVYKFVANLNLTRMNKLFFLLVAFALLSSCQQEDVKPGSNNTLSNSTLERRSEMSNPGTNIRIKSLVVFENRLGELSVRYDVYFSHPETELTEIGAIYLFEDEENAFDLNPSVHGNQSSIEFEEAISEYRLSGSQVLDIQPDRGDEVIFRFTAKCCKTGRTFQDRSYGF